MLKDLIITIRNHDHIIKEIQNVREPESKMEKVRRIGKKDIKIEKRYFRFKSKRI